MRDENRQVRLIAAQALGTFGAKAALALPALKRACKEDEFWRVKLVAESSLKEIEAQIKKIKARKKETK